MGALDKGSLPFTALFVSCEGCFRGLALPLNYFLVCACSLQGVQHSQKKWRYGRKPFSGDLNVVVQLVSSFFIIIFRRSFGFAAAWRNER
jgi:hypothetical protein